MWAVANTSSSGWVFWGPSWGPVASPASPTSFFAAFLDWKRVNGDAGRCYWVKDAITYHGDDEDVRKACAKLPRRVEGRAASREKKNRMAV